MQNRELFILKGPNEAAKASLIQSLGGVAIEATLHYVEKNNVRKFDYTSSWISQKSIEDECEAAMKKDEPKIIVSGLFNNQKDLEKYVKLSNKYRYKLYSMSIEDISDTLS